MNDSLCTIYFGNRKMVTGEDGLVNIGNITCEAVNTNGGMPHYIQ